jgi:pyruvate-formate lyase-activating enzyme
MHADPARHTIVFSAGCEARCGNASTLSIGIAILLRKR